MWRSFRSRTIYKLYLNFDTAWTDAYRCTRVRGVFAYFTDMVYLHFTYDWTEASWCPLLNKSSVSDDAEATGSSMSGQNKST
jgi:hypothetical protein